MSRSALAVAAVALLAATLPAFAETTPVRPPATRTGTRPAAPVGRQAADAVPTRPAPAGAPTRYPPEPPLWWGTDRGM